MPFSPFWEQPHHSESDKIIVSNEIMNPILIKELSFTLQTHLNQNRTFTFSLSYLFFASCGSSKMSMQTLAYECGGETNLALYCSDSFLAASSNFFLSSALIASISELR